MTSPKMFQNLPVPSLPYVEQPTITQFEKHTLEYQELYQMLFSTNQELALWLRNKAESSYENLNDREATAILALEAIAILGNQLTINNLSVLLHPPSTETIHSGTILP